MIATSSRVTMPRSPCSESTGCRKLAEVPVDVNVAAIFRAISPDFPTPETMTRPLAATRMSIARANAGPSVSASRCTAAASRCNTRLPRSTSCFGSGDVRFLRAGLCTDGLAHPMPDVHRESDDGPKLIEGQHVRSVRGRARWIGVRFQEEPVGARRRGCVEQRRDILARAAARSAGALPRLLHGMRRIEYHGRVARDAQAREAR